MASYTTIPKRRTLKTLFTAEELLYLPSNGRRLELVEGKIYEMPPANGRHADIAGVTASILGPHIRSNRLGRILVGDPGFILRRNPDTVRAPDVAFVSYDRLPVGELPEQYLPLAPDLAIEVVSPSNRTPEVLEKVAEWFQAGTRLVWLVYPSRRTVTVYRSIADYVELTEDDTLDGGEVVPGFVCNVGDLFI